MLVPTNRPRGWNDLGMAAWRCTLFTLEFPIVRDIICIAKYSDISSGYLVLTRTICSWLSRCLLDERKLREFILLPTKKHVLGSHRNSGTCFM